MRINPFFLLGKSKVNSKLNILPIAGAILSLTFVSGCTTQKYGSSEKFSWNEGWRSGTVTAIGQGNIYANKLAKHCKNQIATSSTRYATVLLKNSNPPIWLPVPVGLDFSLEENDSVVINIFDCAKQIERHSK